MNKLLALDIDGTITPYHHTLNPAVAAYLKSLVGRGWSIIFITGRPFHWGYAVLKELDFKYYYAVHNGALIFEMPERKIISKKYLTHSVLLSMEEICDGEPSDVVIYSGFQYDDCCFFRPDFFHLPLKEYLANRSEGLKERWIALDSFAELPIDNFPSIKCFGLPGSAERIAEKIESRLGLHAPLVRDPFNRDYYVIQATRGDVDKGKCLEDLIEILGEKPYIVAAGDDNNDIPMLERADVKVVMLPANKELLALADIIAPSAKDDGIIKGLEEALLIWEKQNG